MTKEEILESYMNKVYLGEGAYGVQTASKIYFSKNAKELSIAESACLASLIQLPEVYNPYKRR